MDYDIWILRAWVWEIDHARAKKDKRKILDIKRKDIRGKLKGYGPKMGDHHNE